MTSPSVFIVTLNWNGLEDTLECLGSIRGLLYPNVKVVVVDNASANREADTIENTFPEAVVLKQDENLGFCGGCNVGIKFALDNNADYVMLLNNDTLLSPDVVDRLLEGFHSVEQASAVSPIILEYPTTEKVWFSRAEWDASRAQFKLNAKAESGEGSETFKPFTSEFACGCCMLIPAVSLRHIGLLDERYFAFYDEAEWCARARRNGLESWVIPSAKMFHKVSRSTPGLVSTYLLTRNRLLWMKENLTVRTRLRSLAYLAKEYFWHRLNTFGLTTPLYSKQHSRAVLKGYADYFNKRFYRWDQSAEKILFSPHE